MTKMPDHITDEKGPHIVNPYESDAPDWLIEQEREQERERKLARIFAESSMEDFLEYVSEGVADQCLPYEHKPLMLNGEAVRLDVDMALWEQERKHACLRRALWGREFRKAVYFGDEAEVGRMLCRAVRAYMEKCVEVRS